MHMDVLGWVLTLIVTGVGALVLLYCRWYFHDDSAGIGQFAGVLLGFAGAMYGLVLTDDLVMLVMFWEVTSILSYLLIGHYRRRAASRRAALQALLVTTLGGLVMFVGVVLLVVDAGTSSIREILELAPTGPIVDAAVVMLLIGAHQQVRALPVPLLAAGRDGGTHAGQRLPARRGDGEGGHLPDRALRADLRLHAVPGGRSSSRWASSRCCSAASRRCARPTSSASSRSAP